MSSGLNINLVLFIHPDSSADESSLSEGKKGEEGESIKRNNNFKP